MNYKIIDRMRIFKTGDDVLLEQYTDPLTSDCQKQAQLPVYTVALF